MSTKSIFSNMAHAHYLGNFAFGFLLCKHFMVICVAKWKISTISLTFGLIGSKSHGILGNFDISPTKSVVS